MRKILALIALGFYVVGIPTGNSFATPITVKITHTHEATGHDQEHEHAHKHGRHHGHSHAKAKKAKPAESKQEAPVSKNDGSHSHELVVFGGSCHVVEFSTALALPGHTETSFHSLSMRAPHLLRLSSIFRPPIA